jgi:predicted TIM-barrel fold metal-dependent hydrolase
MIFDINAFIGKWPYWPVRSSAAAEVAEELTGWGIDCAAICSLRSIFVHCDDGNCEVEHACGQHPDRFVPFACLGTLELSHALPSRDYDFAGCAARGFRGVRIYPQHHSYHPLYEPFVDRILEEATARGWPVLFPLRIGMNWAMPSLDLAVMHALVLRHPRTTWVLAGINYLHEIRMAVSLMRRLETVHMETSCVMGFAGISKLVSECGAERILFGSGAPIQHGGAGVEKILHANINDGAREAILSGNAHRLLGMNE